MSGSMGRIGTVVHDALGDTMANAELDALPAHKHDPDEWEEVPAEITVRPSSAEVISFQVPSKELNRQQEAAAA